MYSHIYLFIKTLRRLCEVHTKFCTPIHKRYLGTAWKFTRKKTSSLREKCPTRSYFWSVFSCVQSEYRKIWTKNNSVFGHFSRNPAYIFSKTICEIFQKVLIIVSTCLLTLSCRRLLSYRNQFIDFLCKAVD